MRGARTIRRGEEGWPRAVDRLPRPPALLRVRGSLPGAGARCVAVVGSRGCDEEGLRLARSLGSALGRAGAWVVSGGAAGVDAAAHRGALEAGGRTAVVLGGGLDRLYPSGHRALFARVVDRGGALLSEREDAEPPAPWTFPERNRIVAALSEAVVVVRAGEGSGALLTAAWGRRLGLPVLAAVAEGPPEVTVGLATLVGLPGTGATAFREPWEVLAVLGLPPGGARDQAGAAGRAEAGPGVAGPFRPEGAGIDAQPVAGPAAALWQALGREPQVADDVARAAGLAAPVAGAALLELELRGLAERLPGNRYARRDG